MKAVAAYFREKAEIFRRLADRLSIENDEVRSQFYALADELEASADELEGRIAEGAEIFLHNDKSQLLH